jgi:hypothetical protein
VLPSRWLISRRRSSSSLSSFWMASWCKLLSLSRVGDASRLLGLKILRVQGKGGQTDHRGELGRPAWADRPGPTSARSVAPFAPWVLMHLCTLPPPLA